MSQSRTQESSGRGPALEIAHGAIRECRRLIAEAERVVVLTGAGISAESGVPTFRGEDGLWRRYRPEELATSEAFRRDPVLVWQWYAWRRQVVSSCRPNAAHLALARLALRRSGICLVTQNVDGLHTEAAREAAGLEGDPGPALPLELHGSIFRLRCTGCGCAFEDRSALEIRGVEDLPGCVRCGALLRPDVVWFGEALPMRELSLALERAAEADACLVVGTSAVVFPAAEVAFRARAHGARLIEVNLEETPLSAQAHVVLRAPAASVVPLIAGGEGLEPGRSGELDAGNEGA